jgi:hypothetical protein
MVAEHVPLGGYQGDSHGPPTYTGWYFDLFPDHQHDAKAGGDFVSDVYTSTAEESILYLGAGTPRMGLFRIDTGGAPRLVVGPVATGYELVGQLKRRLTDAEASADDLEITKGSRVAPWSNSYTAMSAAEPDVAFQTRDCGDGLFLVRANAGTNIGSARVRLLDHHGDTIATNDAVLSGGTTDLRFSIPKDKKGFVAGSFVEGIAVRAGDFRGVAGGTVYAPESPRPSMASYQPTSEFSFGRLRTNDTHAQR